WQHQRGGSTRGVAAPEGWQHQRGGSTREVAAPGRWQHQGGGSTREVAAPERWQHQRGGSTREVAAPGRAGRYADTLNRLENTLSCLPHAEDAPFNPTAYPRRCCRARQYRTTVSTGPVAAPRSPSAVEAAQARAIH
ncbi:hypothetical protein BU23DRAFT_211032, partial [Bimuria novae-zelandiae CBS 107.79]